MADTKTCTKCREPKPLAGFGSNGRGGLSAKCRPCVAANVFKWQSANPDKVAATKRSWKRANRDKVKASAADYYSRTAAHQRAKGAAYRDANRADWNRKNAKWQKENRARANAIAAVRRARERRQVIALAPHHYGEMRAIYAEARRLSRETGTPHHVDHIVPLSGRTVSGLHVPWNLAAIPASENRRKGNRHG